MENPRAMRLDDWRTEEVLKPGAFVVVTNPHYYESPRPRPGDYEIILRLARGTVMQLEAYCWNSVRVRLTTGVTASIPKQHNLTLRLASPLEALAFGGS